MIDWELTAGLAALVSAGAASLLLGAFMLTSRSLRHLRTQTAAEGERWRAQFDRLGGDLAQLAAANLALREYLRSVSTQIQATPAVVPPAPAAGRAYDLAARLAASGAASDDLVVNCGLTPAEAELAVLVHGARTRRPADDQPVAASPRGGRRS